VAHDIATIRNYQAGDLDDLYRICLLTADGGQDGTRLYHEPRLPGEIYAAPYAIFQPSLAFVAEDQSGVAGYIVAALETDAFDQQLERDWWPGLRTRYPEPSAQQAAALSSSERFALHDIHHPWGRVPEVTGRYPSHLHINLLPRLQGQGVGRQLVDTLVASLRAEGSPGLHLIVGRGNERAPGFYRHVGFTQVPADDISIFAMDLTGSP
jgi:ribosomal protein S18 acetylase RimI-like enzyme